jgi:hypothetical protein
LSTTSTKGNVKKTGAPEGTYKATVILQMDDSQRGGDTIELPETLKVEARDNTFKLEIGRKK